MLKIRGPARKGAAQGLCQEADSVDVFNTHSAQANAALRPCGFPSARAAGPAQAKLDGKALCRALPGPGAAACRFFGQGAAWPVVIFAGPYRCCGSFSLPGKGKEIR